MGFRLLGVRPLEGCDDKFLKNLEVYKVYPLYNDYKFIYERNDSKSTVTAIEPLAVTVPEDFFDVSPLRINISAVVGKNGSGKSTLMELFFWSINNFAANFIYDSKLPQKQDTHSITAQLVYVEGIHVEFYFSVPNYNYNEKEIKEGDSKPETSGEAGTSIDYYKIHVGKEGGKQNFEAFKLTGSTFTLCKEDEFGLSELFYNEVVNYSHYAYNSTELGSWLDGLFHKNDSYQTPLVLNPMRTRGNFDINTENDLLRQRLLTNLLRPSENGVANFRKFGDNLEAHHLVLHLKAKKTYAEYGYDKVNDRPHTIGLEIFDVLEMKDAIPEFLLRMLIRSKSIKLNKDRPYFDEIRSYILYKIISISVKYTEYGGYFEYFREVHRPREIKEDSTILDPYEEKEHALKLAKKFPYSFLKELIRDNSHITFKLKQSLNYLLNDSIDYTINEPISIEELSQKIAGLGSVRKLIELTTPPIFKIDIILRSTKSIISKDIVLERLSSGEKQLIYTVSSILYHLSNLDSVSDNKVQYRHINLVLEEIELYFHPEYQKQYIAFLRKSIGRLGLEMIKAINIILVTHSPFILSDIPKNNILYIDVNEDTGFSHPLDPQQMKSFGANISDLLADSFFIKEGLVGDFAKERINETLQWLQREARKRKETKNLFPESNVELPQFESREKEQEYYRCIIELIDEPLVRQKLRSMYLEFVKDDQKASLLEIKRLKEAILKLEQNQNA
jgi:predicted ATPase